MYSYLTSLTKGKQLPMVSKSDANENVVIEEGGKGAEHFFKLTTTQNNGWHRINYYHADGTTEELYEK